MLSNCPPGGIFPCLRCGASAWLLEHRAVGALRYMVGKIAGWWFGTCFIFPYIGNNNPNWLTFFRGLKPRTRGLAAWCILDPHKGTCSILRIICVDPCIQTARSGASTLRPLKIDVDFIPQMFVLLIQGFNFRLFSGFVSSWDLTAMLFTVSVSCSKLRNVDTPNTYDDPKNVLFWRYMWLICWILFLQLEPDRSHQHRPTDIGVNPLFLVTQTDFPCCCIYLYIMHIQSYIYILYTHIQSYVYIYILYT